MRFAHSRNSNINITINVNINISINININIDIEFGQYVQGSGSGRTDFGRSVGIDIMSKFAKSVNLTDDTWHDVLGRLGKLEAFDEWKNTWQSQLETSLQASCNHLRSSI